MNKKLYRLMDWGMIEGILYSDIASPKDVLGPHKIKGGTLLQAYFPEAEAVTAVISDGSRKCREIEMEQAEEGGYFAVLVTGKLKSYVYRVRYVDGTTRETADPYAFDSYITPMDEKKFSSGIHYEIYDYLGAHVMERDGVRGTLFAVWAPNAMRVSVIGDFNGWDGRCHQMQLLADSGIFELFIPGVTEGAMYKYEIRIKGNALKYKADPYGNQSQLRPENASIVCDLSRHKWKDKKWMEERASKIDKSAPVSIYEVHLGSFKRRMQTEEDPGFYNYRELAPLLADYAKEMKYTHIELMPVMEHPLDASWGYQVTGYYAATSRYGSPEDLMYLVDYLHQKGIGVILDWVPAHFPKDECGLAEFDGTCLYEHLDPRQGCHPHWGTLIYNYGRPQVRNFLIANALFWVEKFHVDGIRMDAVASMLYLDYGKQGGEWIPNIYGGNENLEAVSFLRELSEVFHKKGNGAVLIAEESTAWPKVTGSLKDDGLGFDYKWNMGWMNDFLDYMRTDPLFRKGKHGGLTFSILYAYSENFILPFSHDEVVHGKGSLWNKMPGNEEQKSASLRLALGYMMVHPGKMHLFMGQEFASTKEWNENEELDWGLLHRPEHQQMQDYVKSLNQFYQKHPALYELDHVSDGFKWLSCLDADHSLLVFLRRAKEEELLVICNFTPVVHENMQIGVPYKGKFKEIFNSDEKKYGGSGQVNGRMKNSRAEVWENLPYSIRVTIPPLGISIYSCTRMEEAEALKTEKKN